MAEQNLIVPIGTKLNSPTGELTVMGSVGDGNDKFYTCKYRISTNERYSDDLINIREKDIRYLIKTNQQ
jgi:hypothetical protein